MTAKTTKTFTRTLILSGAAVAVAASAFAGVAVAQGRMMQPGANGPADGPDGRPGGPRMGMFQMMDTNKDGKVTREEFLDRAGPFFARFDVNKDGTVTKEEIVQVMTKRMEERAARMTAPFDANGDGTVTKEEFDAFRAKRFALLDRNDDGEVDAEELRIMAPMMGQGGGWRGHHRGWGHHKGHGWGKGGPCPAAMRGGMMPNGMGYGMMPNGMGSGGMGWGMQDDDDASSAPADLDNGRSQDTDAAQ